MSHRAFLQLHQKRDVPFYAFYLTGKYRGDDAIVLVQRSPDGVSRIAISLLDDDLRQRAQCADKRWQISVQATEDDCGFLLRLPKDAVVQLSWNDAQVIERSSGDGHDDDHHRDDRHGDDRHDDRRGDDRGDDDSDKRYVNFTVPKHAFVRFEDWLRQFGG
jgi:hypothetical protein